MNRAILVLAFIALMAVYHTAGALFGRDAKLYMLIGLIVVSCLLSLVAFILKRRLRDRTPDSLVSADDASDSDNDCADIIPVPGPRLRGIRRCIDGVIGLTAAFGPPLLVSVFRGDRLSWDSAFTGTHLLAMVAGVALYYFARPWIWRS